MEFFIDTGDLKEIEEAHDWGMVDGVTTNPSLVAKTGMGQKELIQNITQITDGPVSAEVISTEYKGMVSEGEQLAKISENVVIKLPLTIDGLKACQHFYENGIMTNVTLVFSANQALLAAKSGASYVSPFIGRLDDIGHQGTQLLSEIKTIYENYNLQTKILSASIRHPEHLKHTALIGCDVATLPYKVIKSLYAHPLTDIGLEKFLADHKSSLS